MNDKYTNYSNEDEAVVNKLNDTANQTDPNSYFISELEQKLIEKHKPQKSWSIPLKGFVPVFGWAVLIIALVFFLNGVFTSLIPIQQPGTKSTQGFVCPVTQPNGSQPPNETILDPNSFGNGQLWTSLWPDGKIYMTPNYQLSDGSFDMKWGFVRGTHGTLTVEGHRLDAEAPPLRPDYPEGYPYSYGDTGLQILGLIFPTTGCWEVTGHVADVSLTFVTEVVFGDATPTSAIPTSAPISNTTTIDYLVQANDTCASIADHFGITVNEIMTLNNLTEPCTLLLEQALKIPVQPVSTITSPLNNAGGYDWRDTKMYLAQQLPQSPAEANVYLLKSQPASMDDARALAQRFGINSEPQETLREFPENFNYLITDGKQRLQIRSDHYFTYESNLGKLTLEKPTAEQARTVIDNFLKQHGFNFEYHFESAPEMKGQQFYILPLTADGCEMRFDYMMPVRYEVILDNTGENIIFSGYPMDYESIGTFGIITADEAFQKILSPIPQTGMMEISRDPSRGGGGGGSSFYKLNLSGMPISFSSPTPIATVDQSIFLIDPAYPPPTATIEKFDLVYYVRNPLYALTDPNAGTQYLQPAWRFYGHYSSGEEFEILVQALKQEFLLPELAPYTPPG